MKCWSWNFGKVIQRGDPEEIYFDPTNEFVADFIGKINFLSGTVLSRQGDGSVVSIQEEGFQSEIHTTRTDYGRRSKGAGFGQAGKYSYSYRKSRQEEVNTWPARLIRKNFLGGLFDMVVEVKGKEMRCRTPFRVNAKSGSDVYIQIDPKDVLLIGVKNGAKIRQTE